MSVTLGSNTISGLAAGGLDSGIITTSVMASNSVGTNQLVNGGSYSLGGSTDSQTNGGGYHYFPNGRSEAIHNPLIYNNHNINKGFVTS